MPEILVETAEGPKVRVKVGDDPAKHQEEIALALSKGKYEWMDKGGELTTSQKMVRGALLPVVGGALGAAGGAIVGGPPGAVVGEIGGSMLGEAVNQIWDPMQSGASGSVAPVLLAGVGGALAPAGRALLGAAPGAQAGLQMNLQRVIGQNGERVIDMIAPLKGRAAQMFEALKGQPIFVGTAKLSGKLDELRDELSQSVFPNNASKKLIDILDNLVGTPSPGTVNYVHLDKFRASMVDLGQTLSALEAKGGPAYGRAKALYKAMWEDFEGTAGNIANTQLHEAITAFKQELGADILADYFKKASTFRQGLPNVDVNSIMTRISQNSELLEKYFPKQDIGEIMTVLERFGQVGNIVRGNFPTTNLQRGASMISGADAIASALASKPGRTTIAFMAQHGLKIDQVSNMLAQATRVGALPQPSSSPGGSPGEPLLPTPGQ
jgi:hypothetical protein